MSIYYLYCISYDENKDGKSVKFRLAVLKSAHKARYHLKYIDEFTNSALHLQAHLIQVIPKFYRGANINRSEEHTSELQSRETISYAVFCLKKKNYSYTIVPAFCIRE